MKTRVITGAVLLLVLALTVFGLPPIAMSLLFAAMSAIAAYELLHRTGLVKNRRLVAYSMVAAFLVVLWCHFGLAQPWGCMGMLLFTVAVLCELLISHGRLAFSEVAYCYVAGLVLPNMLSSLVRIHNGTMGEFYVVLPFLLAFLSDTGAYLVGRACGKHKLAPIISPNKTVEGMVGGILASILGMVIYGLVLQFGFSYRVNYFFVVCYGIIGSLGAVFGDLSFSVIKRQVGIKDYGNLFPGHGGILDRFDSMTIVGPVTEALLFLLPLVM